jgi:hypothetical protein
MAIDFPNSPASQQNFSSGGKTWVYNGDAWTLIGVTTIPLGNSFNLDGGVASTNFGGVSAIDGGSA